MSSAITPSPVPADNIPRGIAYISASTLVFTVMSVLVKVLSETYPIVELVFARSLFALIPCLLLIRQAGGFHVLRTSRPMAHAFRASFWMISLICSFLAYHFLPMADATAISFSAPLFITALSDAAAGREGRHPPLVGGDDRLRRRADHGQAERCHACSRPRHR